MTNKSEWIPVKQRFPELKFEKKTRFNYEDGGLCDEWSSDGVLVSCASGAVGGAFYTEFRSVERPEYPTMGSWTSLIGGEDVEDVIAWMPLPELYREDSE